MAHAHTCVRVCVSHLHSLEFTVVKMEMKASVWEASTAAAHATSKMTTALQDAILESWRGTLIEGFWHSNGLVC